MTTETPTKRDIRKLKLDELKEFFIQQGDKAFRAHQVYEWLWKKSAKDFEQMTNLSITTREMLKMNFAINHVQVDTLQRSTDGTIKNAVKLHDGLIVESVLIPAEKRITACVSSQVGCSLDCKFCATARLKRMRNQQCLLQRNVAIMNFACKSGRKQHFLEEKTLPATKY